MCDRVEGKAGANETPIGFMPGENDMDLSGMAIAAADARELLHVDTAAWKAELLDIEKYFSQLGDRLPERLRKQLADLGKRLG